jgi:hypothetical protein
VFKLLFLGKKYKGQFITEWEDDYLEFSRTNMLIRPTFQMVVNIAKELSLEPATPDETRDILNLKGLDKVNY